MSSETPPGRDDYNIAIICALETESTAIQGIFDVIFATSTREWHKAVGDHNTYTTGRIGRHYVVLAHLPGMGKIHATRCAVGIRATFSKIELAIVAGVCGGSPFTVDGKQDIYLGDVVISTQLVQADYGRENVEGFAVKDVSEGNLGLPPPVIRSFLHKIQTRTMVSGLEGKIKAYTESLSRSLLVDYPESNTDNLFPATYLHKHRLSSSTRPDDPCQRRYHDRCEQSLKQLCVELGCEVQQQQRRRAREVTLGPSIHFGAVCSSDTVKKNGASRDDFIKNYAALAFEMEGAGVFETLPTIVVKGVCDYADSHKNKSWQSYAAMTAAACSKALLEEWTTPSMISLLRKTDIDHVIVKGRRSRDEVLRQAYLQSLYSEQINTRLNNIKLAHPRTCQWVFESSEFRSWLDPRKSQEHNRILWIRGKPGAGKSTLMKHIHNARSKWFPGCAYAGYFFHARGDELQKTRLGMLRSLLYQLFANDQSLLDKFVDICGQSGESALNRDWPQEELEDFLSTCVHEGWLRKTFLLLDALDECDLDSAREIVAFFEDLAISASHQACPLFICISIRYFPNIGLTKCVQLNLESKTEHAVDLDRYIADKLRIKDDHIAKELCKKANHVFLWAVLVLSSLNKAYDQGYDSQTLSDLLADTPEKLHQIFEKLLGAAEKIPVETIIVLQLVLFSAWPTNMRALYLLSVARTKPEKLRPWPQCGMTDDSLQAYFITVSRGLLEFIPTGFPNHQEKVQFIHESVRDYLLHDLKPRKQGTTTTCDYPEICHEEIARACIKSMSRVPIESSKRLEFVNESPELAYAVRYALMHIDMVSDHDILVELLRGYAKGFIIQHHCPLSLKDPLIVSIIGHQRTLSLSGSRRMNCERLLNALLGDAEIMAMSQSRSNRLLYEDALRAAVISRWHKGVEILLQAGAEFDISVRSAGVLQSCMMFFDFYQPVEEREELEEIAISLVKATISAGRFIVKTDGYVLGMACKNASLELISLLLQAGAQPNIRSVLPVDRDPVPRYDPFHRYNRLFIQNNLPMDQAVYHERVNVIKLLSEWGADPNLPERKPLAFAVTIQDEDLILRLLESGADPNISIDDSTTILMHAVSQGNSGIVRRLLAFEANPGIRNENNTGDAWSAASQLAPGPERQEMMALLKTIKPKALPQSIPGRTV